MTPTNTLDVKRRISHKLNGQRSGRIPSECNDINSQRTQTIIRMSQQGATFQQIGDAIGVTRQRAKQLKDIIYLIHGSNLKDPSHRELLSIRQVSKITKARSSIITALCKNDSVPCTKHTTKSRTRYLIDRCDLQIVKNHLHARLKRICTICNTEFHVTTELERRREVCSDKCGAIRRSYWINTPVDPLRLTKWRRSVATKLMEHTLSEEEVWIPYSQAIKIADITKMQFQWLKIKKIITTREHPTRKWKGKPTKLYSITEMNIIAQVMDDYITSNH